MLYLIYYSFSEPVSTLASNFKSKDSEIHESIHALVKENKNKNQNSTKNRMLAFKSSATLFKISKRNFLYVFNAKNNQ